MYFMLTSPVDLDLELKGHLGKFAYRDSGPVKYNPAYTIFILSHGMGYHSSRPRPFLKPWPLSLS